MKVTYVSLEEKIIRVFKEYLEVQGYNLDKIAIYELLDIYQDLQQWDGDNMITGNTLEEIDDWIRHTKEVDRLVKKEMDNNFYVKNTLILYFNYLRVNYNIMDMELQAI